ncbi:MAG: dienelactone hydrolase family protein [Flavisolibacter sp.]
MKKNYSFLSLLIFSLTLVQAQDFSAYQKKWLINGKDSLPYRVLLPINFQASKKYPLIVFLHGSGERGRDNEKQLMHGGDLFLRSDIRASFPAIVIFPQCPDGQSWTNYKLKFGGNGVQAVDYGLVAPPTPTMTLLQQLFAKAKEDYRIDHKRIYLGGLSLGGMGTFDFVIRHPKIIAAAFPICGAADAAQARTVRKTSWWIFHGGKDNVVPPASSIAMAEALKKEKARVKLTIYPEANHNSWDSAFAEKNLFPWMFAQHR